MIRLVTNLSSFLFYISIRLGNVNTHVTRWLCRVRPSNKHPRLKKYYTTMRFFLHVSWMVDSCCYIRILTIDGVVDQQTRGYSNEHTFLLTPFVCSGHLCLLIRHRFCISNASFAIITSCVLQALLFLLTSNRHNEQTHHASTNAHTIYRFYIEVFWAPNLVKISMCMYIYGANIYLYISIYKYLFVYICVCFSYCFYVGIP